MTNSELVLHLAKETIKANEFSLNSITTMRKVVLTLHFQKDGEPRSGVVNTESEVLLDNKKVSHVNCR